MLGVPRKILFPFLLVIILAPFVVAIPAAVVPVNGQVISDDWKFDIEEHLLEIDKNTTAEIVIYVVDSLYGHGITKDGAEINEIFQLGVYIFNELALDAPSGPVVGIGKAEKDNGVLVLVAMEDREWRIEVGYGLEGYLTDVESKRIAEEHLVPNFQEGNYGEGLAYTVIALALEIPNVDASEQMSTRGRYVYDGTESFYYGEEELPWWVIVLIVVFVIAMVSVGGRFGGRVGGRWGGSRGGGGGSGGGGGGGGSGGGGSGGGW